VNNKISTVLFALLESKGVETHFIRAEVINWQKLLDSEGFSKARENGLIRTEGKDYLVQDGDVIEIKADA